MSDSIVFKQDPHPRAGKGVVIANELGEEVFQDLRDAYAIANNVDPTMAGVVFAELREVRRDRAAVQYKVDEPVKMEYRLGLWSFIRDESEAWLTDQGAEGWVFVAALEDGILLEREVRS